MPVTFADGGNIQNVTDTEPVSAAVANRPHNVLKTRTEELETFAEQIENLALQQKAASIMSTEPITWNGTVADGGDGAIEIGAAASGEIQIHLDGSSDADGASDIFIIPYNELASFFSGDALVDGDVLYVPFASLAARTTDLTFPYTVTAAGVGYAAAGNISYWDLPIGRVVDGDFIFCYSNVRLAQGQTAHAWSNPSPVALRYGIDYHLNSRIYFTHATNTWTLSNLAIQLYGVPAASNIVGTVTQAMAADEILYLDLDLNTTAAAPTVAVVAADDYVQAYNRLPLFRRFNTANETALGYKPIYFIPQQRMLATGLSGADYYLNPSVAEGAETVIGSGVGASGSTAVLAFHPSTGHNAVIQVVNDDVLEVASTSSSLLIDVSSSSEVVLSADSDALKLTGASLDFEVNDGSDINADYINAGAGVHNIAVDGDYKHDSARDVSAWASPYAFFLQGSDGAGAGLTRSTAVAASPLVTVDTTTDDYDMVVDLTPFLVDGATYDELNVDILAGDGSNSVRLFLVTMSHPGSTPTTLLDETVGCTGVGEQTLTFDDGASLSFTVDKAVRSYTLGVRLIVAGATGNMLFYGAKVEGTSDTVTRGG